MPPRTWLSLVLVAPLALAGCGRGPDKAGGAPAGGAKVLTLGVAGDPWLVDRFADATARLSHGRLRIEVRARWRWGEVDDERGLIADVRAGKLDLGAVGTRAFPSLRPLDAPLLIDSYALQQKVLLTRSIVAPLLGGLRPLGLAGLGVLPAPLLRPLGVTRPLLAPSDYAGARIDVRPSVVAGATLRSLGAVPSFVAGGARLNGVDGIVQGVSAIENAHQDAAGGWMTTDVVLWARPTVLFAGSRLTPGQRAILARAATVSAGQTTLASEEADAYDTSVLCGRERLRFAAAGPERIAALRRAVAPAYAQLERDSRARRAIAAIQAERTRLAAPASPVPRCGRISAPARAPARPAAVDGEYRLSVPARALAPAQRIPEACGTWEIVLDRGQFRLTQRSSRSDWIADGAVSVRGGRMTWTVAHYGSMGPRGTPDGDPVRLGQQLRFGWRRTGTALVLSGDRASPVSTALAARPLQLVAPAPSRQPLENPAALDGTWAGTATGADVLAHHDDPGGIPDNTGPMRLTIHDGRFRWTERTPNGLHWSVGTTRFAGDTLELVQARTDDGNPAPAPIVERWSVYHDRLTLRAAPGFSPEQWAYHPWARVR